MGGKVLFPSLSDSYKNTCLGNSQVVQQLELCAFTAMARVQSLVGELRSRKQRSMAKKKKKNTCLIIAL